MLSKQSYSSFWGELSMASELRIFGFAFSDHSAGNRFRLVVSLSVRFALVGFSIWQLLMVSVCLTGAPVDANS